jgi:NADPH2:quinone reductase
MRINIGARIVLCGMISQYDAAGAKSDWEGQVNIGQLIMRRATIQGFLVLDFADRFEEAITHLAGLFAAGKLHYDETVLDGLENVPAAVTQMFSGANTGKLVVHLAEPG